MAALTFNARAYAALSFFVSTDETRWNISGVHFEQHPRGGVIGVATDGHRLVMYFDIEGTIEGGPFTVTVPKAAVAAARKAKHGAKMAWLDGMMMIDDNPDEIEAETLIGGARFVEWRRVLPDEKGARKSPPKGASIFNSRYMADWHNIVRLLCPGRNTDTGRSVQVHLPFCEGGPSWVVIPRVPQFRGVIMPMRDDSLPCRPEWLDTTTAAELAI